MGRGSKKNRQKDFQKVKLKVGKKLKKADNVTNASFKTRSIQISQQLKSKDGSQPSTRKKQNITELLTQCRHYSASVRHEGVTGLRELVSSYPELLISHPADILEKAGELLSDKDSVVRQGSVKLLKVLVTKMSEKNVSPFFPLVCAHLCCAMTHINDEIQADSLMVLDLFLDSYPRLMISRSSQVLSNFVEQISRQNHGQTKRTLTSNPNSKMSSQKWRASVLKRLQAFMSAILNCHGNKKDHSTDDIDDNISVHWEPEKGSDIQTFPLFVVKQWDAAGYVISSSALDSSSSSEDMFGGKLREFTTTLVPLLLECWVECIPAQTQSTQTGGLLHLESASTMYSVVEVTRLLLECTHLLITDTQQSSQKQQTTYMKDVQQHFLNHFPYTVQDITRGQTVSKKQKFDKVASETLNLSICDVMTHFLSGTDGDIDNVDWVMEVIQYLADFLSDRFGSAEVSQSCRTVVTILERMLSTGLHTEGLNGLLSAVFRRYQTASPLSQEKRVYLQFLANHSSGMLGESHKQAFFRSLPELLPLVARDQRQVAALVLDTMKKAACQRCGHFLEAAAACANGTQWFDPSSGAIIHLSTGAQRQLIGLLYNLPVVGAELLRMCTRLVYSEHIQVETVTYLIQVLHNRYMNCTDSEDEAVMYISYLTSLILGMSQADIKVAASRTTDDGQVTSGLGGYTILDTSPEGLDTGHWERHSHILQAISSVVTQFDNTAQILQIIVEYCSQFIRSLSALPLQVVYGICSFVNYMTSSLDVETSTLTNLSISLVYHTVITWEQPTNQVIRKSLQVLACNLVTKLPHGIEELLQLTHKAIKDGQQMSPLLQTVSLFLSAAYRDTFSASTSHMSVLTQLLETAKQRYASNYKPTIEMEKQLTSLEYLLSQMI